MTCVFLSALIFAFKDRTTLVTALSAFFDFGRASIPSSISSFFATQQSFPQTRYLLSASVSKIVRKLPHPNTNPLAVARLVKYILFVADNLWYEPRTPVRS